MPVFKPEYPGLGENGNSIAYRKILTNLASR